MPKIRRRQRLSKTSSFFSSVCKGRLGLWAIQQSRDDNGIVNAQFGFEADSALPHLAELAKYGWGTSNLVLQLLIQSNVWNNSQPLSIGSYWLCQPSLGQGGLTCLCFSKPHSLGLRFRDGESTSSPAFCSEGNALLASVTTRLQNGYVISIVQVSQVPWLLNPQKCAPPFSQTYFCRWLVATLAADKVDHYTKEQWKYPWRTSISTLNQSVLSPSTMTAASQFSYTQRISCTYFIGIPQSARICHIEGRWMLSKAALKSTKLAISIRRQTILSTHPLPLLKPPWFSRSFLQYLLVFFPKWWAQRPSQEQIKGRYHGSYYTWNGLPSWK